jgi:acetyl esterase/lipase
MHCPPCTPTLLADGTDYLNPPTEIALAVTEKDYQRPRQFISLNFFREALVSEFLLRGLIKNPSGELCFPERGCVTSQEIDEISPLQLAKKIRYPPLYQAMGTADEIFEVSHIHNFHSTLKSQGIPCEMVIIEGAIHAFDVREHIGGEVHETIIKPAVNWVAQFAGKSGGG